MITFTTDTQKTITLTEEELRNEAISMIQFALNDKEYPIEQIDAKMIAEDITGIMGNHQMPEEGMAIINEALVAVRATLN